MKIKELFEKANEINKMLGNQLMEISVKQHQITISVSESLLYLKQAKCLLDLSKNLEESFISTRGDTLYFSIADLSIGSVDENNILYPFVQTINEMSQEICSCPSLEFIICSQYLKCFLDKPGLTVKDLSKYEEVLGAKTKGELELHPQRPYLLFINEDYEG